MSQSASAKGPHAKADAISSPLQSAVMGTYARQDVVFERGEGCWLTSTTGERYLDFGSGVAVNSLGHAHPKLVAALTEQAGKLWHTSNLYRVAGQERLAAQLIATTFAERSSSELGRGGLEGAIKTARRYHYVSGNPSAGIITFEGSFHGRTLATHRGGGQSQVPRRLRTGSARVRASCAR